jgi:HAD superfamily hydrolase (TIGR01509 family)
MTPEPGMAECLAVLAARLPLAVATNRGSSMHEILRHFGLVSHFRAVVTCRDVERPKPWPDMLLLAAERLGLGTGELLFVGDSELDLAAARAAGIRFIAYKGEIEGDFRVGGYGELLTVLAGEPGFEPGFIS